LENLETGLGLVGKTIRWLAEAAAQLPPFCIQAAVPVEGGGHVQAAKNEPLKEGDFSELIDTLKAVREERIADFYHANQPYEQGADSKKVITLPPVDVPSLKNRLERFQQWLEAVLERTRRERGAQPSESENAFMRAFAQLARQKAGRPFDQIAVQFFEVTFGRSIDVGTYTRRRTEREAPTGRKGALGRAEKFLAEKLETGPVEISKLIAAAGDAGISRTTLFRAVQQLGVEPVRLNGKWAWRRSPIAKRRATSTKRN
jgi:hypothetical protein